jgi:hypothetical protein
MDWPKLLAMHWHGVAWLRSPEDVAEAAGEMRREMRNPPDNDELCEAIRWLAGPEGRQEKAPSLRELIRAVYICRKSAREDDSRPAEDCGLCRATGWMTVYRGWGAAMTFADKLRAIPTSWPCACRAGDDAVRQLQQARKTVGALADMQELGRAQAASIAASVETWLGEHPEVAGGQRAAVEARGMAAGVTQEAQT